MTQSHPPDNLPAAAPPLPSAPSLADVMALAAGDPAATPVQRKARVSALRCFARILGQDPRLIAADPQTLSPQIKAVVPAAHGITIARWGSIRSLTLTALAQAGIPVMRGRSTTKLTADWRQLALALPTPAVKHGLSRFIRFCVDQGVPPAKVDDAVFDRFRSALERTSIAKSPQRLHQRACQCWNKASQQVVDWPMACVSVPSNPRHYSFDWGQFPASFVADTEAYLQRAGSTNPFDDDYVRPLRPATIDLQRSQIKQMASLLVHAQMPIAQVTSLAVLVEVANARRILEACHQRRGKGSVQLHAMALLLKAIAQRWVKAAPATIETISGFARKLTVPSGKMTEKNRRRLNQFDNRDNLFSLLDLPRKVFQELKQAGVADRSTALRAMNALAIELLINAPMRIGNLIGLDLNQHMIQVGRGSGSVLHIAIPAAETKTNEPYEVTLPAESAALLATYRKAYLPHISSVPTSLLFPNNLGRRRSTISFAGGLALSCNARPD